MDFTQYQPVAPPAFQPVVPLPPKEKSYIHHHQPISAHHDLHAPLSISIPSSHLEHSRIPKTTTHPLLTSSAFKAWEPTGRHVHRQASAPGQTSSSSSSMHSSNRRHAYSTRRQQSIENMPDLFNHPYGGMYGGAGGGGGQGQHLQGQHLQGQHLQGQHPQGQHLQGQHLQGQHPQGQHPSQPPYYHHTRQKSYSTHSTTEVTV